MQSNLSVLQKQCLLTFLGYDLGKIDGVDGPKTKEALNRFKSDYGVGEDGLVGAVGKTVPKLDTATKNEDKKTGTFWDEIEFFSRDEFKCKCGGRYCNGYPSEMKETVVKIADAARKHFEKPAHVVSGLRCQTWNKLQGGVSNSQHMFGEAIDLRIDGVSAIELQKFVSSQPNHRYSYSINSTNVHVDVPKGSR